MGSLISVNVGLPQDVAWHGSTIRTAVWKRALPGRVKVRRLNIDGDGQGDLLGHGGENRAVMVYQLDSYRYWEEFLKRHDFEYGQFGENLTVEGLPDAEVCIGDRYRIGSALFEVTQPRVTCYRVGMRMGNPDLPSLLVSHKRPGFYFRVIQEGEVGAGDEIVKISDGPERVTVAEVDALLYLPGHPLDRLTRALNIPALSEGWKGSLRKLLLASGQEGNAGLAVASTPPSAWPGFRPLCVVAITTESEGVLSFTLKAQDEATLPPALPGQFLAVRVQLGNNQPPLLRSYSLSGPQNTGLYRISVKRATGPGSHYLHDRVRVGDMLESSAPRGSFLLQPGSAPVVFLGAGIGATPLLSMLHALVESGSQREIWWCYGARNGKEHPFEAEVRSLLDRLPQSHAWISYSRPEPEDRPLGRFTAEGHLTLSALRGSLLPQSADFYLCGPAAFIAILKEDLAAWGVPADRIYSESFGSGPSITPGIIDAAVRVPHQLLMDDGTGPAVSFTRSGITAHWDERYGSLLELAEACDVPVRWSCRAGVCHTCESGLIEGEIAYRPEPLDRPAPGDILICCSTPMTETTLDL